MTRLHDAIAFYHELSASASLAQSAWDVILPGMTDRHLIFGDRPLCTVLRPMFHTSLTWHYLSARTLLVLRAFQKTAEAMLASPDLRAQVHLDQDEEELVAIPTGYETTIPTARLDSFFSRRPDGSFGLSFIEFNGESPAGMAYNDVLSELFLETPLMHEFGKRYHVEPLLARRHAADALLRIYYQWRGGYGKLPDIAIVDWAGVPTTTEFRLFANYFARYGIKAIICTPDELDFRDGKLYASGEPVDFVYKRVLTTELLQRYGTNHPIIHALRANAICMANPFTCKLLHKKASFAVVSDERNAYLFTPLERQAIQEHIPWTRTVEERHTIGPGGAPIDLLPWASAHREELVVKPNDEYGGKGVLIGWETDQETWDQALQQALAEPAIVQARVEIAYEEFPRLNPDGSVEFGRRLVDCDPFLFHGDAIGGCLTRLSTVTLLNVTAGGGSVIPAFVVDPK